MNVLANSGNWQPFLHPHRVQENLPMTAKTFILMKTISIHARLINKATKQSQFQTWLHAENSFISALVKERVSNRQACLIFNACLSFTALISISFTGIIPLMLCLLWFGYSIYLAKKGGLE